MRRLLARLRPRRRTPLPASIGRYRVVRKIGEGGMGTVFEAEDEVLGRRVALKRLKAVDDSARRRFWREARAAARLAHPNVCALFELGEDASGPFFAMELLAGEPLSARLRRAPMSPPEAVALGAGMLAALQAIHDAGLVHRDIKPSNVFLTPHGPRLLDFGLVHALCEIAPSDATPRRERPLDSGAPLTDPQLLIGTPRYMAPEQILGHAVDGRTDLFAAGAVLYEALAGRPAFGGDTHLAVFSATLQDEPSPLPDALAPLEAVLRRALAKRPADRFGSAFEMADALHAAAAPASSGSRTRPRAAAGDSERVFAGREAELAWLEARLSAALSGTGGVVFVTGERGAGKTALVGELLRRVRASGQPITLASGRCFERRGPGEALQPFLDALGKLLTTDPGRQHAVELVRSLAPTTIGVLMPAGLVPDPDGSLKRRTAGATRARLIRESGDFMEAATRLYPVLLLLEDLHWADPVSVELLAHLGRRSQRQRLLLLCTCRPSAAQSGNPALHRAMLELRAGGEGRALELGPLAVADVEQWLERRFSGADFAASLAPLLHARAEGLPLFARSLIELLAGRGDIVREGDGFRLARPLHALELEPSGDVKDLVRAHLATLPQPERELLASASVLGKEFSSAIARALSGGDELELEQRLQRLALVHRVIESRGEDELPDGTLGTRYRFAHGLYQLVLYEDLIAPRRAELHRRAGELLARHCGERAPTRAAQMAEHFERGRDFARAARLRTLAGEHAAGRFAADEAREHYRCALELVARLPAPQARPLEVALLGRRAATYLLQARFDDAAREYQAMLELAGAARLPAAECEAQSALCQAYFFAQRLPEMAASARAALRTAERLGAPHQRAEAHARAALVLVVEGRLDAAAAALDTAVADARASGARLGLQIGLGQRGFVHYWQTEFEAAERALAEALVLAEERGDGFEALTARMFLGLARVNRGRVSEGLADFEHAIVLARQNGDRFWEPRLVSHLGFAHRELGAVERARDFDAEALALARANPSPWAPHTEGLLNLSVDATRSGDHAAASGHITAVEAVLPASAWMRWMYELRLEAVAAEHLLASAAHQAALERAGRLSGLSRRLGSRGYASTAARLRGEVALARREAVGEAASGLELALQALSGFPAPLEGWKSRRVLALSRLALGEPEAARLSFAEAARDVDAIAAGVDDATLRQGFLDSPPVREVLAGAGRG